MAYENPDLLEVEHRASVWTRRTANFDGAAPEGHRGSYFYDEESTCHHP